ncbi:MAG: hypothetical protein ACYTG5_23335, partial [Planctomycetota bacterium]
MREIPERGSHFVFRPIAVGEYLIETPEAEEGEHLVHGVAGDLAIVLARLGGWCALSIIGGGEEQHVQVVGRAVGEALGLGGFEIRMPGLCV